MQLDLYTKDGSVNGKVDLSDDIFGIDPSEHAIHLSIVSHLAKKRQGTHKTKVRHEVSGGGRKPWKQKGRGTARAGSTRSPIWVGGGTIHGPKPHEYNVKLPKKLKKLARKSALSIRAKENNLMVLESFGITAPKTKSFADTLKNLKLEGQKVLVLVADHDDNTYKSSRNIPGVTLTQSTNVSAYDIMSHKKVLMVKDAVSKIDEVLKN
ncbi:MAG: 50S ribosomal protein L4 [Candidatus Kapaibacteriales bacterium]